MGQQIFKIARLRDKQIAAALERLTTEAEPSTVGLNTFGNHISGVQFPNATNQQWLRLIEQDSELISDFSLVIAGVSVSYYRGGVEGAPNHKSPILDDLAITVDNLDAAKLATAAKVLSCFRPVSIPSHADPNGVIEAQRAIQEATFARLQLLQEQMAEHTVRVRKELDDQVAEKKANLEIEFKERDKEANASIHAEREELRKWADQLDQKAQALDDSDNTHARRKIRDQMLSDVKTRIQNFGVSAATEAKRRPVLAGIAGLIGFLALFFAFTLYELTQVNQMKAYEALGAQSLLTLSSSSGAASAASAVLGSPNVAAVPGLSSAMFGERVGLWIRLVTCPHPPYQSFGESPGLQGNFVGGLVLS